MNQPKTGLFCFSPPVMIATFAIEVGLAIYTLWNYNRSKIRSLVVALLVLLAAFQLAEYMICEAVGLDSLTWARIGYVAITLLPPIGIHLAYEIAESKKRPLLRASYASAGAFVIFFALIGHSIVSQACLGNYVIFDMAPGSSWGYALYYYGFVTAAMVLCALLAKGLEPARKKALALLAYAYAAFLLPTTTVNLLAPSTIQGIPSIMCGFAVILAVILGVWIMPVVGSKKWTNTLRLS